jgi:hypothetical protein
MSNASIVVTEYGATVTIQINRAFAERLIDFIDKVPANSKAEGDNQVLAGLLNEAIRRVDHKSVEPKKKKPWKRSKVRKDIGKRRDAIEFWRRLTESIQAEDGTAFAVINERIAWNETKAAALVAELEQRDAAKGLENNASH